MRSTGVMLDAVYDMHEARTAAELHEAALRGLRRTVGAELSTWTHVDPSTGAIRSDCEPEPLPSEFLVLGEDIGEIPFVRTLTMRRILNPLTLSDVWDAATREQSAVYQDVIRRAGCDHQLQIVVSYGPGGSWEAIAGSRADRDFDDDDRATLAELARHLRQAHARLVQAGGDLAQAGLRAGLSRRQAEALQSVAGGATMPVAAARLGISPRTLENHLQGAYRRLGVNSRVAALHSLSARREATGGAGPTHPPAAGSAAGSAAPPGDRTGPRSARPRPIA